MNIRSVVWVLAAIALVIIVAVLWVQHVTFHIH